MATAVMRRLDTSTLQDALVDQAYVFGTDAHVFLDRNRDWVLTGKVAGSHIRGTSEAIESAQRAPQRVLPASRHVACVA